VIPEVAKANRREATNDGRNVARGKEPVAAGGVGDPRRGGSAVSRNPQVSRTAAAAQSVGWLEAVNSQIGLKPISMAALPTIRQQRDEDEFDDSVTSYKVVIPREMRREIRRKTGLVGRSADALRGQYMEGVHSYRRFFSRFARLFRWINETAYGISVLFLLLAIVGVIMNKHSLTILGISAIVLLNVVRIGAGLFNLVVIPFRDNPVKGLLFLFPPVTAFYLWQNWSKWRKPIRRIIGPVVTLAVVIAAYVYVPWINGNKRAQANIKDRIDTAVESIKKDVTGSL